MSEDAQDLIALTADIVTVHVSHNSVDIADVVALIRDVHGALAAAGAPETEVPSDKPVGAVTARASIKRDRLISMIDGRPYKMLTRHLKRHGYTPATYREAFDLPRDYPMVAPDYADLRRDLAVKIGLGRKPRKGSVDTGPERKSTEAAASGEGNLPLETVEASQERSIETEAGAPQKVVTPQDTSEDAGHDRDVTGTSKSPRRRLGISI